MSMGGVVLRGIPPGGLTVPTHEKPPENKRTARRSQRNEGGNCQQSFNYTEFVQ